MSAPDKQIADAIRKKKINQISRSIRKKYLSLKLGKSEEDEALNKLFQPVTIPLQQIVQKSMTAPKVNPFIVKMLKKEVPKKENKVKEEEGPSFLPVESVAETSVNDDDDDDDNVYGDDSVFEESTQNEVLSHEAVADYLDQYPAIAQPYIINYNLKTDFIDDKYGPSYDEKTSKWYLGKKVIDFDRNTGNIHVDGQIFKGTPGLYQLIFYTHPQFEVQDRDQYKELLELTGVHKKINGTLKPSGTIKYLDIIKPMFNAVVPVRNTRMPTRSQTWGGTGLEMVNNNIPLEYVYWDDPNELVERLKLLVASQEAGNNSHQNEIIAIINELKEANIIRDK